jgi:hypothetical protein
MVTLTGTTNKGYMITPSGMRSKLAPATALQPFGSQPFNNVTTGLPDPGTITGTPLANAQAALEAHDDTAISVAHQINPGAVPDDPTGVSTGTGTITIAPTWVPFYIPTPLPGELLESYLERLQARLWVGTVTVVDDPMGYPDGSPAAQLQPKTVTKVSVTTAAGVVAVPYYNAVSGLGPLPAPNPAPQVETSTTAIRVQVVPDDWVPSDHGGSSSGVPPVVFPPLTASPCDKFPFGVFCWIGDQLTTITTAGPIPWHVTVDFPAITVPGMPTFNIPAFGWDFGSPGATAGTFVAELTGASYDGQGGFFELIRNVLGFMLWLWGLWVYGKRKFGGKGLPDGDGQVGDGVDG